MAVGGARVGAGRPPKEKSRAKDRAAARAAKAAPGTVIAPRAIDDGTWLTLPREGRTANPPAWPLTKASRREQEIWRKLWKLPEAIGWEKAGNQFQVAFHVRCLARAEDPSSPSGMAAEIRRQQDGLGLTPGGKRSLHWKVGQPEMVSAPPSASPTPAHPTVALGPKERMRLVSGDGSA